MPGSTVVLSDKTKPNISFLYERRAASAKKKKGQDSKGAPILADWLCKRKGEPSEIDTIEETRRRAHLVV